jgi:hypothetical protein
VLKLDVVPPADGVDRREIVSGPAFSQVAALRAQFRVLQTRRIWMKAGEGSHERARS